MNVGTEENVMIDWRLWVRVYFWVTITPIGGSRRRNFFDVNYLRYVRLVT